MSITSIRSVTRDDAHQLWLWCNDPAVRANAFSQAPVPWPAHVAWFDEKLVDGRCRMWILECDGRAAGLVRYDGRAGLAEIDVVVASDLRGRGLGSDLLRQSAPRACRELGVTTLVGIVKATNRASRRAFERAGFRDVGEERYHDVDCRRYEWSCAEVRP